MIKGHFLHSISITLIGRKQKSVDVMKSFLYGEKASKYS